MKLLKGMSIWIILSLFIQFLGLYYINNHFLVIKSPVVTPKVNKPLQTKKPEKIIIDLPNNAEKINVSYDAKYLSYYEDAKLKIVNTKDQTVSDIEIEAGTTISFYKWIPGKNKMLLVEKNIEEGESNLILYYYDLAKKDKVKIRTLDWLNEKSEIQEIEVSTVTGITYIRAEYEENKSYVYKINRDGEMEQINTVSEYISKIALVKHEDKLIYESKPTYKSKLTYESKSIDQDKTRDEDKTSNKIYNTMQSEPINIKNVKQTKLLQLGVNNNIYIGEIEDKSIKNIYYRNIINKSEEWKCVNLKSSVKQEDILICIDGKIYINNLQNSVIIEVMSGKQISYEGKLLYAYSKGIASLINGKVYLNEF